MELRPYQNECLRAISNAGNGRWLCQLATGLGKTVIFSRVNRHGRPMLILSHRQELVWQPLRYFDCPTAIEMAGDHAAMSGASVVSASVQTMARRMTQYSPDAFGTIVVDEAHHATADSYKSILDYFRPDVLLGFTATPNRADGRGLDAVFDDIIFERSLRWGIENGWLSDIHCKRIRIGYDLTGVATRMGDYAAADLERALNVDKCNDAIAEAVADIAEHPVLIFAVDVAHAKAIAARIPGAVALDGSAPRDERKAITDDFKAGKIPVLVNCSLFTEGTDLPNTRTVIIARPTKSVALYTQMVGRGTRLSQGKDHCLLIDCVGVSRHSLCTAPSLIGVDVSEVPERFRDDLSGDLLKDIPEIAQQCADTPESWIDSIRNVSLWAQRQEYDLHNVNWFRRPDGSMSLSLPDGNGIVLPPPDALGRIQWRGYDEPAQRVFDEAYNYLREKYRDQRVIWDVNAVKHWGSGQATEKQVNLIKSLSKKRKKDVSGVLPGLTKSQASAIIDRLQVVDKRPRA